MTNQAKQFLPKSRLSPASIIMQCDSYKSSHNAVYPKDMNAMLSFVEPRVRVGRETNIVPIGAQMWAMKNLTSPITTKDINEAEAFFKTHGEPFDRKKWEYIVDKYNGYIPITIRTVPEGTPVPSGNVIATVLCTDPEVFWLASYIETTFQRGLWYPTTVASRDRRIYTILKGMYKATGADEGLLPFALHDFGGRGVTCSEQAEIGGMAHLVHFMGSDTVEGVRAANYYYDCDMAAFSVPATEHSVECSYGFDRPEEYIRSVLDAYAKPGAIVSIVIDGYDYIRETNLLCTIFKDNIVASGAKVVFRPDSGDMMETVPAILQAQEKAFGFDLTSKGLKKIRNVGIIQGDGVDELAIHSLLTKLVTMGYSADNVIFGSGGALLQKMDRDTFKFAQKTCYGRFGTEWRSIAKDPVTDPGKKSLGGNLSLARSRLTGEYFTYDRDRGLNNESTDLMVTIYENGKFYNHTTLAQIRERALS